jgi:TRAP-type C4-dicarboxylate transport system permease small subunit
VADGTIRRDWGSTYRSAFRYLSLAQLAIVPIISYELIGRNLSFGSVSWVEEFCKLIELWVGMLFIAMVQLDDRHIAASLIAPRSSRIKCGLDMLRYAIFFTIGIFWIWIGVINAYKERYMNSAGGLELPLLFTDVALPVAGFLLAVTAIVQVVRVMSGRSERAGERTAGEPLPDL